MGHVVGFRFHGGAAAAVAAISLVVVFPLMFASSALVPIDTMPAWLRPFSEHQQVSQVVDTARALALGRPAGSLLAGALAWTACLLAIAVPLGVRRFYRAG